MLWAKRYGEDEDDFAWALAAAPNGDCIVAGSTANAVENGGLGFTIHGDVFVRRISGAGNLVWQHVYSDSSGPYDALATQAATDVAIDLDGNVVVSGYTAGSISLGGDALTVGGDAFSTFLLKLSPAGTHLFSKRFGGASYGPSGVSTDPTTGDIVLGMWCNNSVNFGGGALPANGFQPDICVGKLSP